MTQPPRRPGRPLYAAPGPTNIPDSVLEAVARATTDFAAPAFREVYDAVEAGLRQVLGTGNALFFYAASGHATWEATFVNLFSAGDTVLMLESGIFSGFWTGIGRAFGLDIRTIPADWRRGADLDRLSEALRADRDHRIAAVCAVHNDTASGVTLPGAEIRERLDDAGHPALYVLDTISSAGSLPLALDEWGVDAAVGSSQKGLMALPGIGFTAVSDRALARHRGAGLPRAYVDWSRMLGRGMRHSLGTVPANLFLGLREGLRLIEREGLDAVLTRHAILAKSVRAAIAAWHGAGQGPALYCLNPARVSDSVSTILLPPGHAAAAFRAYASERLTVTFGGDLGLLDDRIFRIGHMGDLNEAMVLGMLGAAELSMQATGIPHQPGLAAALRVLATPPAQPYSRGGTDPTVTR
jgi:alanine-glyoxylate transaminase/serine-glyoxylate transaminase/serine-pyruvate transaminase